MGERKGEKIGWVGGWLGGFIWVAGLSGVFLYQGKRLNGVIGLILVAVAAAAIIRFAPWRFPSTRYWKLMLAPYGLFFASLAWAVWSAGGFRALGLNAWNLLWILPMLIPFGTISKRRWRDGEDR